MQRKNDEMVRFKDLMLQKIHIEFNSLITGFAVERIDFAAFIWYAKYKKIKT